VLLVQDDHAGRRQRREQRRAGADNHVGLAAVNPEPLVVALAVGEHAVQDGQATAEVGHEPLGQRRSQRDLRHQHERGAPAAQRVMDQLDVDLGLAAAGDAEHEVLAGASGVQIAPDPVHGRALGRREHQRFGLARPVAGERIAVAFGRLDPQHALGLQAPHHVVRDTRLGDHAGQRERSLVAAQELDHRPLALRIGRRVRRRVGQLHEQHAPEAGPGAQHPAFARHPAVALEVGQHPVQEARRHHPADLLAVDAGAAADQRQQLVLKRLVRRRGQARLAGGGDPVAERGVHVRAGREEEAQAVARRREVVMRDPAGQLHPRRIDERLRIHEAEQIADPLHAGRRRVRHRGDHPVGVAAPQGDHHAAARAGGGHGRRDGVRVVLEHRREQGDRGVAGRGGGGGHGLALRRRRARRPVSGRECRAAPWPSAGPPRHPAWRRDSAAGRPDDRWG